MGRTMHRFLVVIEKRGVNYSAYSPDLPGCVATGDTAEDAEVNMHHALQLHVEGMIEDGEAIPESAALAEHGPGFRRSEARLLPSRRHDSGSSPWWTGGSRRPGVAASASAPCGFERSRPVRPGW